MINFDVGLISPNLRKPSGNLFPVPLPKKVGFTEAGGQRLTNIEIAKKTIFKSKCGGTSFVGNSRDTQPLQLNQLPVDEKVEGALPPSIDAYFQNKGKQLLQKDLFQVRKRQDENTKAIYDYFSNLAQQSKRERATALYLAGMNPAEIAAQMNQDATEVANIIAGTTNNSITEQQQLLFGNRTDLQPKEAIAQAGQQVAQELGEGGIRGTGDLADQLREEQIGRLPVDDDDEVSLTGGVQGLDDLEPQMGQEPGRKQAEQDMMSIVTGTVGRIERIMGIEEEEAEEQALSGRSLNFKGTTITQSSERESRSILSGVGQKIAKRDRDLNNELDKRINQNYVRRDLIQDAIQKLRPNMDQQEAGEIAQSLSIKRRSRNLERRELKKLTPKKGKK